MSLEEYARNATSAELPSRSPKSRVKSPAHGGRFFIQRHNATRLHYDFRLEIDGTLKSWAVPKGPSLDPSVKHLAAMVEDHPLDYGDFEGNIPKGNYGGGSVMLWDRGTFDLIGEESGAGADRARRSQVPLARREAEWNVGDCPHEEPGQRQRVADHQEEGDDAQTPWNIEDFAYSVKTGRTQEEIAADLPAHKPTGKSRDPLKKKYQP